MGQSKFNIIDADNIRSSDEDQIVFAVIQRANGLFAVTLHPGLISKEVDTSAVLFNAIRLLFKAIGDLLEKESVQ